MRLILHDVYFGIVSSFLCPIWSYPCHNGSHSGTVFSLHFSKPFISIVLFGNRIKIVRDSSWVITLCPDKEIELRKREDI